MGRNRLSGGLNFDERRLWQVGVAFPLNEYNIVKEASEGSSISRTVSTYMMAGLDNTGLQPLQWKEAEKLEDRDRHLIMIRLTKPEYDKFIAYCDNRGETMSDCVRRLIFGFSS